MPVARVTASCAVISPRSRMTSPGMISTEAGCSWSFRSRRLPTDDSRFRLSEPPALPPGGAVTTTGGKVVWASTGPAISPAITTMRSLVVMCQSLRINTFLSALFDGDDHRSRDLGDEQEEEE